MVFGLLNWSARRRIERAGLTVVDRVYGLMQSGGMAEEYVLSVPRNSPANTVEIYFHPDRAGRRHRLCGNPDDLATLLSPRVLAALGEREGRPCTQTWQARPE